MGAWLIRAGRREQWCLANGVAGGGFPEVEDLTKATTRDAVHAAVMTAYPAVTTHRQVGLSAQLHALRNRIVPGDLVALPLKATGHLALGRVARTMADAQRFVLRVWDAPAFLDALLDGYPRLPAEVRSLLPLRQTWVLLEDPAR